MTLGEPAVQFVTPGKAASHDGSTPLAIMSESFWSAGSFAKMFVMMVKSKTPLADSSVAHSVRRT